MGLKYAARERRDYFNYYKMDETPFLGFVFYNTIHCTVKKKHSSVFTTAMLHGRSNDMFCIYYIVSSCHATYGCRAKPLYPSLEREIGYCKTKTVDCRLRTDMDGGS